MSKNQKNVKFYLIVGIIVLLAIAITLFVLGFTLGSSIFFYASGSVLLMFIILAICGQKCLIMKNPSNAAKLPEHEAKIYINQLQGMYKQYFSTLFYLKEKIYFIHIVLMQMNGVYFLLPSCLGPRKNFVNSNTHHLELLQ